MKNKILKNIVFFTIISFIVFGFLVDLSFAASCGSSNGGTFASPPTSNLCSIDTSPSSVVTNPTTFNWSCYYDCCNSGSWVDRSASTPKASSYYDDVAISATGQYQSIGDNGDVFVSSDFGSTWTKYGKLTNGVGSMGCANVKGFAISETGQRQIMACDTGMFYSSNYGQTWTKSGTISGFVSLDASQNGQYLVANSVSNIYTSSDYGQTWTSRTTALTSAGASSSSGIYASAISSDGQKIGVTGKTSTKDAVFYSSNGGTSFTKKIEYSLGALDDYKDVDMSADGTRFSMIYKTATTGYRVYYSVDSATTFSYYDFGTSLVRRIEMSASGRCQIASVGVGQVYVSSNYGASWSLAVSGNLNVDVAMSASGLNKAVVGTDAIYAYSASPSTNCYSSLSCSAINSSIVNGSCGSSSGQTFTSAPSTNLCNLGTASSVTSGTSTYTWTCSGSGGGTNASCSATRNYIVTYDSNGGSCTPASRTVSYNATADAPSCSRTGYILSSFTRTSGSGGTLNASTGAVTNVTGSQTIRADWTLIVNGSCGTASKIYLSTASSYGADTFCATGTASPLSPVFPVGGTPTTWQCQGSGGGTTATCTASKNRKPAIVNGTPSYSVLAGNKINFTGFSASDADGNPLTYTWGCTNGGTFTNNLIANPEYIAPATARTDTCSLLVSDGKEVATSTVTVTVIAPAVVNGSCGTASKIYLSTASSYGADTFCATGTASPLSPVFPVGGTPTTWQCQGSGGGTTATCTASKNRKPAIVNGTPSYSVLAGNKINFTGFSASDADGNPLTYTWGCTNGGTFTNNLIANPEYIAPATARTDTCSLLVSDGKEVATSTVTVTVIAPAVVNGSCGTASKIYLSTASSYGADTFCATGTASPLSPVFPVGGTPTTWQCQGSGGGTTATCTASKNRKPAIVNGTPSYSVLAGNKINFTGFSASDADGNPLTYTWGCTNGGTFTNNLIANPEYIAPATARTDTCSLLVSDGKEVATSTVTVTVIAPAVVNGSCGTASKIYLSTASSYGADTFCATGTASPLSPVFPVGGTPTTWQCQGSGGGTTATCTASKNRKPAIVNGTPSYSVLAGNKINFTGFSASDADGNPLTYTWGCTNGGTFTNNLIANPEYIAPATARTDTCSLLVSDGKEVATSTVTVTVIAPAVVNGSCGTASKIYLSTASSYGADTFCATGTASPLSPVFPVGGTPTTWQCQGSGGGTTATCTASKNRKPAIVNGTPSYSVLAGNKINFTGFSASDADGNPLTYTWGCTNGGTFTNNLIANPEYIAPATPRTDTCNLLVSDGMEVVFATVTVSVSDVIVYGTCGTAAKAYPSGSSSYGLDTFCNPGTPSPLNPVFPVTGTPTTWQCQGSGGGTTAICTATLNAPLTSAISADGFKNPLEVANDLSSTEEECWYCSHYKNTSNEIVPAAGGAVGNIQFKFNYQGTTNLTGYQFAMSTGANPDLAVIKSDDWVNYSVAPGGTVTVSAVKIGGINNNLSVKLNASESLAQIPYNSSPYNWWVKVKNSGGEESAWIPATGHSYTSKSHRYPVVKVALRSMTNDLLACTTVASSGLVFNASDPCYATCGAANVVTATDLENSTKWKCSVCYDQVTNTPKPCAINSVTWELPADAPVGFGLKTGSTLTTANPTFTGIESGQIIDNVRITISGSSCSIEGGLDSYTPLPLWIER